MKKIRLGAAVLAAFVLLAQSAHAHVTVYPREAKQGAYEKFTVRVPTESEAPTVKVEIDIPDDVEISRFEPKPGWTYELTRDENGKITRVVWSADGPGLSATEFGEFHMQGRVGSDAERLVWRAYQTYGDGTIVQWVGGEGSDRPASVTVVAAAADEQASGTSIDVPLLLAIAALALSAAAFVLALRRRR